MSWTDEKVQKLRELWTKGHTASEIAGLLGDTTRNAVIGKAHRLDLEERAPSKSNQTLKKEKQQNHNLGLKVQLVEKVSLIQFYLIKILRLKTLRH